MFVSMASDDTFRRLSLAPLDSPSAGLYVTPLSCDRVYFGGDRGICLVTVEEEGTVAHHADLFDNQFRRTKRVRLTGPPSRVRVSADGRRAAATVFESGHAYLLHGFSTRTTVFDMLSGVVLGDLEEFTVWNDGRRIHAADFNFWGLTFARDGNAFFATLDTGGTSYLVKGDIDARELRVVRPGVECPSLSPDNTRIVFKKRIGSRERGWWQLTMIQLSTMTETPLLKETRSVDDQVDWLDDDQIAYHLTGSGTPADVWALRVDGTAAPRMLLAEAYSPAAVR